jgi:hypothetical protein
MQAYKRSYTRASAGSRGVIATDRVQNVGDATAGPCDPRHDPSYGAAGLHDLQIAVEQQMKREHAAESGRAHLRLCTVPKAFRLSVVQYYLTKYLPTLSSSYFNYIKFSRLLETLWRASVLVINLMQIMTVLLILSLHQLLKRRNLF